MHNVRFEEDVVLLPMESGGDTSESLTEMENNGPPLIPQYSTSHLIGQVVHDSQTAQKVLHQVSRHPHTGYQFFLLIYTLIRRANVV